MYSLDAQLHKKMKGEKWRLSKIMLDSQEPTLLYIFRTEKHKMPCPVSLLLPDVDDYLASWVT